jgi:ComF family protein
VGRPPSAEPAWHRAAAAVWEALRDALFPRRCLGCRAFLPEPDGPAAPDLIAPLRPHLCRTCREGIVAVSSPLCPRCGIPFKGGQGGDHLCGHCIEAPPVFRKARAAFVYDRTAVELVQGLKYRNRLQLAGPLGRVLRRAYEHGWQGDPVELVVPVPLHAARLRERGFNQAEILVRRWHDPAPAATAPPVAAGVLHRTRATAAQAGLGRQARERNIRGAFEVAQPRAIEGRRLLLVDDVFTTGSTAEECARRLLAGGAERVDVLTLARVP